LNKDVPNVQITLFFQTPVVVEPEPEPQSENTAEDTLQQMLDAFEHNSKDDVIMSYKDLYEIDTRKIVALEQKLQEAESKVNLKTII